MLLIYRRRTTGGVFLATTANDKLMYVLLAVPIFLGFIAVIINQIVPGGHGYDYRETISPWLRSLFIFQPRPELMVDVLKQTTPVTASNGQPGKAKYTLADGVADRTKAAAAELLDANPLYPGLEL